MSCLGDYGEEGLGGIALLDQNSFDVQGGGPQMVEVSRDGKLVYFTNSLYDVGTSGGMTFDERFFPEGEPWRGRRTHQVRLQGGDASSDSYCFPSEP
jgi:hypothetical protein